MKSGQKTTNENSTTEEAQQVIKSADHADSVRFEALRLAAITDIKSRYASAYEEIKTAEGLARRFQWEGKKYASNAEQKFLKYLQHKEKVELARKEAEIKRIEESEDFNNTPLIITVEWRPSRMWRSNPKSFTNYGFESRSIGGCGYDKRSTATAEALNSFAPLLKLLFAAKNKTILEHGSDTIVNQYYNEDNSKTFKTEPMTQSDINRKFLGYGSGYGVLPHFEGGVGVESHRTIIENLGLVWESVTSSPNVDVFVIRKTEGVVSRG